MANSGSYADKARILTPLMDTEVTGIASLDIKWTSAKRDKPFDVRLHAMLSEELQAIGRLCIKTVLRMERGLAAGVTKAEDVAKWGVRPLARAIFDMWTDEDDKA
eukprot:1086718-Pleurochrysis_carterae.AAC.7